MERQTSPSVRDRPLVRVGYCSYASIASNSDAKVLAHSGR